jgi:hypothetical protein
VTTIKILEKDPVSRNCRRDKNDGSAVVIASRELQKVVVTVIVTARSSGPSPNSYICTKQLSFAFFAEK